jgi:hypothetical protein
MCSFAFNKILNGPISHPVSSSSCKVLITLLFTFIMHNAGMFIILFPITKPNIEQLAQDKIMRFSAFCTFSYKVKSAISILRCVMLWQHAEIPFYMNFLSGRVVCLSLHVHRMCYSSKWDAKFLYWCSAQFVLTRTSQGEEQRTLPWNLGGG